MFVPYIQYVCIMSIYVVNQYFFDSQFALLVHLTELEFTLRKILLTVFNMFKMMSRKNCNGIQIKI